MGELKNQVVNFVTDTQNQILGLKILGWIAVFLTPVWEILFAVGALLMTDLITGIWASMKEKKKIKSSRLRESVTKSASYLIAISAAYVTQTFLIHDALPIIHITSGLIGVTEILSIYENLSRISGVPFANKLKEILQPKKEEEKDS